MTSPFDFLNAINLTKKNLMEEDPGLEKEYSPWMINKGLSFFIDTILYANEMNKLSGLDNKPQFDFYINIVKPRKRFSKWYKKSEDEDLAAIMKCYGYSINKAKSVMSILSEEQIKTIRDILKED